jgi:hypothetical protein
MGKGEIETRNGNEKVKEEEEAEEDSGLTGGSARASECYSARTKKRFVDLMTLSRGARR